MQNEELSKEKKGNDTTPLVIRLFSFIREIEFIKIGFNKWNGFYFSLLSLEIQGENKGFEGDFLGIHIASDIILLYVLFIEIEFKSPFLK